MNIDYLASYALMGLGMACIICMVASLRSKRRYMIVSMAFALLVGIWSLGTSGCDDNLDYRLPRDGRDVLEQGGSFLLGALIAATLPGSWICHRWIQGKPVWKDDILGKCRKCGYDLRGSVSGVCSECGTAYREKAANRSDSPDDANTLHS